MTATDDRLSELWPTVEAIARALDREDELDGEAVARLIRQPAAAVNARDDGNAPLIT
jgi:hypothetical protein